VKNLGASQFAFDARLSMNVETNTDRAPQLYGTSFNNALDKPAGGK